MEIEVCGFHAQGHNLYAHCGRDICRSRKHAAYTRTCVQNNMNALSSGTVIECLVDTRQNANHRHPSARALSCSKTFRCLHKNLMVGSKPPRRWSSATSHAGGARQDWWSNTPGARSRSNTDWTGDAKPWPSNYGRTRSRLQPPLIDTRATSQRRILRTDTPHKKSRRTRP